MSSHEHLSAASNDRKARLAQLKSLKRKQAPSDETPDPDASTSLTPTTQEEPSVVSTYLSGRNFDPATRNVKLGFENTPISNPESTLEYKAAQLALQTQQEAQKEQEGEPLDLFRLQPKKPNWDLKRDLEAKMREGGLEVKSQNAIARLVRERVEMQRKAREGKAAGPAAAGGEGNGGDGVEVGLEGGELVEAMHQREVEEERERAREDEEVVEG